MKRIILFKGKRVDNGEWIEGFLMQDNFIRRKISYLRNGKKRIAYSQHEVHSETVCQFTGLQDNNGKRIFEGDLCKDLFNRIMKVVPHNFRFKFECISGGDSDHWKYADFIDWCKYKGAEITHNCRVEIIRNIHD